MWSESLCPTCAAVVDDGGWQAHFSEVHLDYFPYKCVECHEWLSTSEQLNHHAVTKHKRNDIPICRAYNAKKESELEAMLSAVNAPAKVTAIQADQPKVPEELSYDETINVGLGLIDTKDAMKAKAVVTSKRKAKQQKTSNYTVSVPIKIRRRGRKRRIDKKSQSKADTKAAADAELVITVNSLRSATKRSAAERLNEQVAGVLGSSVKAEHELSVEPQIMEPKADDTNEDNDGPKITPKRTTADEDGCFPSPVFGSFKNSLLDTSPLVDVGSVSITNTPALEQGQQSDGRIRRRGRPTGVYGQWLCPEVDCGRLYTQSGSLRRHLIKHHAHVEPITLSSKRNRMPPKVNDAEELKQEVVFPMGVFETEQVEKMEPESVTPDVETDTEPIVNVCADGQLVCRKCGFEPKAKKKDGSHGQEANIRRHAALRHGYRSTKKRKCEDIIDTHLMEGANAAVTKIANMTSETVLVNFGAALFTNKQTASAIADAFSPEEGPGSRYDGVVEASDDQELAPPLLQVQLPNYNGAALTCSEERNIFDNNQANPVEDSAICLDSMLSDSATVTYYDSPQPRPLIHEDQNDVTAEEESRRVVNDINSNAISSLPMVTLGKGEPILVFVPSVTMMNNEREQEIDVVQQSSYRLETTVPASVIEQCANGEYRCTVCDFVSCTPENVRLHATLQHSVNEDGLYVCDVCSGVVGASLKDLFDHKQNGCQLQLGAEVELDYMSPRF